MRETLVQKKVMDAYRARPPYQKNDYVWWVSSAKQQKTKEKRLNQMVQELKKGDVYMKMKWRQKK